MADTLSTWQSRFQDLIAQAQASDLTDREKDQLISFIQNSAERIAPVSREDVWSEIGYVRR